MRKLMVLLAAIALFASPASAFDFDDIEFWVGTGTNRAGLVIDWNDGKQPVSLARGYRWNGTKTGEDMLAAIAQADSRLYVNVSSPGGFGVALFGVGYDLNENGFGTNPPLNFVNGISVGSPNDNRVASDPADHYREGWNTAGYWSCWLRQSTTANWSFSGVGMSGRTLSNGVWDGWSFAPGFNAQRPATPVAAVVPEPGTLIALAGGLMSLGGLTLRKKTR